ncbi:MAG: hypothetical protein J7M26_06070 [Armatimonadetes bacterium]|nr:hypothetical protein [Armatimonadota bacterium]
MPRLREEDIGGITENRVTDGRITLTADQRQAFPDGKVHVILWLMDKCVRLCTAEWIERLREEILREWPERRLQDIVLRQTVGTERVVTIDDAGRIRIPYMYLDFLNLNGSGKKAWLVPLREGMYELWHPDDYKRHVEQDVYELANQLRAEAQLAGQVTAASAAGVAGPAEGEDA